MAGEAHPHVFAVRGDIRRLKCDAWLLPTDPNGTITRGFWQGMRTLTPALGRIGARQEGSEQKERPNWNGALAMPVPLKQGPRPWLVQVTKQKTSSIELALEGLTHFVQQACATSSRFRGPGSFPLLAVPVIGTGHGGNAKVAGALIRKLLVKMRALAMAHQVDLVLVAHSMAHWGAIQNERRKSEKWWPELQASGLLAQAKAMGQDAAEGKLVLFLGAGVSSGAGLPGWGELLTILEKPMALSPEDREAHDQLGFLDRAQLLAAVHSRKGKSVGRLVADSIRAHRYYGLGHALLASTPVTEVITTNYDTLFEDASSDLEMEATVLPYSPARPGRRWLLKLHGCVTHPEDIVLTRESYLRYASQNSALAGIVQAMLMTKRMVFVGFSLTDENFHRIVDAVRLARDPLSKGKPDGRVGSASKTFGQAIMVNPNKQMTELWKNQIDILQVSNGRMVDILLDRLNCEAAQPFHLLDEDLAGILSEADMALKTQLIQLLRRGPHQRSAAWPLVEELLSCLGGGLRPQSPKQ